MAFRTSRFGSLTCRTAAKIGESESYGMEEDDLLMLDSVLDKRIKSTGVKKKPAFKKPAACTTKEDEPADISEPKMADGKSKKKCTFKRRKTSWVCQRAILEA